VQHQLAHRAQLFALAGAVTGGEIVGCRDGQPQDELARDDTVAAVKLIEARWWFELRRVNPVGPVGRERRLNGSKLWFQAAGGNGDRDRRGGREANENPQAHDGSLGRRKCAQDVSNFSKHNLLSSQHWSNALPIDNNDQTGQPRYRWMGGR
jgi:hypothetical protein